MNWINNFVRPKIQALMRGNNTVPDNLWTKCPNCDHMLFHRDLEDSHNVCKHCNYHIRISLEKRLSLIFDDGKYTLSEIPPVPIDPLKFKDLKKYTDRLKEYKSKSKSKNSDSVVVAFGYIEGVNAVILAYDFNFMGGSMGMAAGKAMVVACDLALKTKTPLIAVTASGGARMQEGIFSLMQMPRTLAAIQQLKDHKLPYITVLTDPTTGGVSASFAMTGDISIAEPGAIIGFAGARVIEETIRQKLPNGFQKSEFLLEHGMIDMVVNRKDLKNTLGKILKMLSKKNNFYKLKE